jgi:hypothetical protein
MLYAGADVGTVAGGTGYSFTRASDGYYENADGTLTLFGSGALRRGDRGVLVEGSRTNLALWSRDFTNAAWVKVNATAALNQVGVDGTVNGASSLTATAGLGTVLQTVVSLSAARATTCYVKRITGTGTIEFTSDNISYTDITSSLSTGSWFRAVVTGTITNPVIGFRITTSGDAIAVDFAGLESAAFPSSPIITTSAAATRAADLLSYTAGVSYPFSAYAEYVPGEPPSAALSFGVATSTQHVSIGKDTGGTNTNEAQLYVQNTADQAWIRHAAGTANVGATVRQAVRVGTDDFASSVGGSAVLTDTSGTVPTMTTMRVGTDVVNTIFMFGYIRRIAIFNTALTDAELQGITT